MKRFNQGLVVLILFLIFSVSCNGSISKDKSSLILENFEKISIGMTKSQVEKILGKGKTQASSSLDLGEFGGNINSEILIWEDGMKTISITLTNNKVQGKAQFGL